MSVRTLSVLTLLTIMLILSGCGKPQNQHPTWVSHPEPLIYRCFELTAAQIVPILGETASLIQKIDTQRGFCTFADEAPNADPISNEGLLPAYASLELAHYVTISILDSEEHDARLRQNAELILAGNSSAGKKFFDLLPQSGHEYRIELYANLLEQLATAESTVPHLSRQFLSHTGDDNFWRGALWLWQETSNQQHLATILTNNGYSSITIQALVAPAQSEAKTQAEMSKLLEYLIEVEKNAPI